jgi:hypothetical protein
MNEVDLIRKQLSLERQHAVQVSHACASALWATAISVDGESNAELQAFRQASVEYLVWIYARFEEREQVFRDIVQARFGADDPKRRAVAEALASPGTSREVLTRFDAALASASDVPSEEGASQVWNEFLKMVDQAWSQRRDALDRLFEQQAKVTDWRAVSGIDADSIFGERKRFERVRSTLPAGIEMIPATERH